MESAEEATEVVHIIEELLSQSWTDRGTTMPLRDWDKNIIVVAPYNAQVNRIRAELEQYGFGHIPVGTVDKFQGQEAPIAIVSMAASTLQDVPRGIDFLLSKNRLNVALSRAQWASYLVFSPGLLGLCAEIPCQLGAAVALCTTNQLKNRPLSPLSRSVAKDSCSAKMTRPGGLNRPGLVGDFILWRQLWSHGKTSEMSCLRQSADYEFGA